MILPHFRSTIIRNRSIFHIVHYFLKFRYFILKKISQPKFIFEVDFFDIQYSIFKSYYPANHYVFDNNMYGIGYSLGEFSGVNIISNAYIEHGVFFGDSLQYDEPNWFVDNIVVFSDIRKNSILKNLPHKSIISIGSYINYARSIINQTKFESLRKKIGKTLLVFPPHSSKDFNAVFDLNLLHTIIEKNILVYNIQTVIVCLYWKDLNNSDYMNFFRNYHIVSAGYKWDYDFLNRLKTFILLSDITMSGNVGTHIGYCVGLDRPHTIVDINFSQNPTRTDLDSEIIKKQGSQRIHEMNEVFNAFKSVDNSILYNSLTDHQILVTKKYWGDTYLPSKDLSKFLKND